MKLYLSLLTCVPLLLSQRDDPRLPSSPPDLCEAILRAPVITERRFDTDFVDKPADPSWIRLDGEGFQALHDRRMTDSDTAWAIGKITIRDSRIGLLVLNSSAECDHTVRYLTLTLFEGCSKLPHWFSLVENDDHGGIYERSAYLTVTNDTLVVSMHTGELGEWGVDTVFTRTDRIRLAPVVDTISTETGFAIRR
ncbi:MAG TPA: hypothetical protein PKY96_09240 [Flavobacteriales bacterium]|nr:hypothetical protein [Flavobacteriales bacterium]